jgi:cytochrome P450
VTARFVPPHPPRGEPVAVWRGFVGERGRSAVYGWSKQAFRLTHIKRKVFAFTVHIPLDPDAIERVMLGNPANYEKPRIVKKLLDPMIGRGLLSSDGTLWRDQRRIVAANFTPPAVDALMPAFAAAARLEMDAWEPGTRDMALAATETTMRVITNTLFAGDPRLTSRAAMAHISAALEGSGSSRIQAILGLPIVPWSRKALAGMRGQQYLRDTLTAVVRDRLPDGGPDDFLGRLVRALRERFAPDEATALAIDNAATFYLAGHETTANAVTWMLFLLSEQPDLQREAAAEARAAFAAGEEDPHLPDRLPLLRRILEETLRLYPPVPRFDREVVAADRIGEHDVLPGEIVSIWPWLLHRHEALWDDPDSFDPGRWSEERRHGRHRFRYIPFGGGPRVCVGARFAAAEALTVMAHWLGALAFRSHAWPSGDAGRNGDSAAQGRAAAPDDPKGRMRWPSSNRSELHSCSSRTSPSSTSPVPPRSSHGSAIRSSTSSGRAGSRLRPTPASRSCRPQPSARWPRRTSSASPEGWESPTSSRTRRRSAGCAASVPRRAG